jgi:hypothetical protein
MNEPEIGRVGKYGSSFSIYRIDSVLHEEPADIADSIIRDRRNDSTNIRIGMYEDQQLPLPFFDGCGRDCQEPL